MVNYIKDTLKRINALSKISLILSVIFLFTRLTPKEKDLILNIKKRVNEIEGQLKKATVIRSYEKDRMRTKLQYYLGNRLIKIEENHSDGSDNLFRDHHYFSKNQLIYVEKHTYFFEDGIQEGYRLEEGEHSIRKIYFKKNKIFDIQRIGKGRVFSKEDEYKFIMRDLDYYTHISALVSKPYYRIYEGDSYGFFKAFPLSGREKKVKITYEFKGSPSKIIVYDHHWNDLYKVDKEITNGKKYVEIDLNNKINPKADFTEADLDIDTQGDENAQWWIKIEFEGEEIKIG